MRSRQLKKIFRHINVWFKAINFKIKQINRNYFLYILLIVVLPIWLIKFLGILQPLEYALYDFWYYINPIESVDERIVIVKWDENCIDRFNQSTISDRILIEVLEKIEKQKPRLIGLDLYRNVSTPSSDLDKIENAEAWSRLSEIFNERDNIIGIKKIIKPKVDPPVDLERKELVAAADVSLDSDSIVRRAYVFPKVDLYGYPAEAPYIGWALGFNYLVDEGWDLRGIPENKARVNQLEVYHKTNQVIGVTFDRSRRNLDNFFHFDPGWNFLINWRKTKLSNNFITVSIADLIDSDLESSKYKDLFRDRLVIIGNLAISRGDIHQTPLTRWGKEEWTFGAEIVAQVASTLIGAVKDGKSIVKPVPVWIEYFISLLLIYSLTLYGQGALRSNLSINTLRKNLILFCLINVALLIILNAIFFDIGIWLNTTTALISVIFGSLFVSYYCQYQKQASDLQKIVLLSKDFNHNLSDASRSLNEYCNNIYYKHNKTLQKLQQDYVDFVGEDLLELDGIDRELKSALHQILVNTRSIENTAFDIEYYKRRVEKFIEYSYTKRLSLIKTGNFNREIERITEHTISQIGNSQHIFLEEKYDKSIKSSQKLYIEELEIIVENILRNAFAAVEAKVKQYANRDASPDANPLGYPLGQSLYSPRIILSTEKVNRLLIITVKDNGIGIPKKLTHKVFELNFSLVGAGRGIGLYIVKQAVKQCNGSISLVSNEGEGTCFCISLPMI